MKNDAGFTLLELMITVMVGAIILGVGVPNMLELVRNNRIAAQANEFMAALATARGEALKRGLPVVVCRNASETGTPNCGSGTGWQAGWAIFVDTDRNGAFTAAEQVLQMRGPLSGSNTLTGNNNVANRVIFTPQGVVGAGGIGAFTLLDSRGAPKGLRLICLGMTGRARIFNDGTTACPGNA